MSKIFNIYKNETHNIVEILGFKFKSRYKEKGLSSTDSLLSKILFYQKLNYLVKDGIFDIYYEDNLIHFYLPCVHYDCVQRTIFEHDNFFEYDMLDRIRKYIKKGAIVMDAGANIGNHSIYFAKICNAQKVYSFEPMKTIHEILNKNIKLNNCEDKIIPYNLGLGEKECNAEFNTYWKTNMGGTSFKETSDNGDFKFTSIDNLKLDKLDFVKIDVEGHQLKLLKGAKETFTKLKPIIWIEMLNSNHSHCNEQKELVEPSKILEEYGYVLKEKLDNINFLYLHKDSLSGKM